MKKNATHVPGCTESNPGILIETLSPLIDYTGADSGMAFHGAGRQCAEITEPGRSLV